MNIGIVNKNKLLNYVTMRGFNKISFLLFLITFASCVDEPESLAGYKTENIVVIVMDGARYSETWGDSTFQNIPKMKQVLGPLGAINTNFYNNGITKTVPGHTAITTGVYQEIDNSGKEIPLYPSIFQYWLESSSKDVTKSWIITSKDKLEVLAETEDVGWTNLYNPMTNCGIDGLGSGYRHDSITFNKSLEILKNYHPNLVLINFREPDYSAHRGSWNNYLDEIAKVDRYIYQIWSFLETDVTYKGSTTLFVTNDHGRHLDGVKDGFVSHGDGCEGCRHLFLYATGPDFKEGSIVDIKRELVDISSTIEELLGFEQPFGTGVVMTELFK